MSESSAIGRSVFVCYAHADEKFVTGLAQQLRSSGIDIWIDQRSIAKGVDWDRAIDDALRQCSCFLIVLSPNAVASEEVRGELRTAHDLRKPIVPVLFRKCEIPRLLKLIQYVDLSSPFENTADGGRLVIEAIHNASPGSTEGIAIKPRQPDNTQTLVTGIQTWAQAHPFYLVALGFPPLAFATGHLFRLPMNAGPIPNYVFLATAALCLLAFWLRNRAAAVLIALGIGAAFVIKPWLVPFEGFGNGRTFPYGSATAQEYWLPGALFLVLVGVTALFSKFSRLVRDLKNLRPNVIGVVLACVTGLSAYSYFSRPTVYDAYRPFRAQYGALRERLRNAADAVDRVTAPFPLKQPLDPPLVLDETGGIRSENASTTGHLFLYQHLREPDAYFGEIENAFTDNLHLYLRDTGPDPVMDQAALAQFVSEIDLDTSSLERILHAPYVVILKPLRLDPSKRVDTRDIARVGPYRVFLFQLTRNEILFAADIESAGEKFEELKAAVNATLERSVAAKILR